MKRWFLWTCIAVGAIGAIVAAGWAFGTIVTDTKADNHRTIIFASADELGVAGLSPDDERLTAVNSQKALEEAFDASTRSVILTSTSAMVVEPDWIRAQMQGGLVVAVIGAAPGDLQALLGILGPIAVAQDEDPEVFPTDGYPKYDRPFFSVAYDFANGHGGRSRAATTWEFDAASDALMWHVERYVGNVDMRLNR